MQTAEGRAVPNGASFDYEYYLKDHLGNTRVAFNEAGEVMQETHYYPFGLRLKGGAWQQSGASRNKFLYNGKELEGEGLGLRWYHYGARFYDPQLGRWWAIDPVDEFHSPYTYVGNNPPNYIDPFGLDTYHFDSDWNITQVDQAIWWQPWTWGRAFGNDYTFAGQYMGELAVLEADRWINPSVVESVVFDGIIIPPGSDAIEANPFIDPSLLGAVATLGFKGVARIGLSIADDAFVHITTKAGASSILKEGLNPKYSGYVTKWKYVKGIADAKQFNTALYRKDSWNRPDIVNKFNKGAKVLEIDGIPKYFGPRTNWTNGVPQWVFKQTVTPSSIILRGTIK